MPGNRNEEIQVENTLPGGSIASYEIPIGVAHRRTTTGEVDMTVWMLYCVFARTSGPLDVRKSESPW